MTASQAEVERIVSSQNGVICRRQHPALAGTIDALLAGHRRLALLPGIHVVPEAADLPATRLRAAQLWEPDAVFTHQAAAMVTFWPAIRLQTVTLAAPTRKARRPGYTISRRSVPADLVVERGGLRCTAPALTALDLVDCYGGEPIDVLLRSQQATVRHLYEALAAAAHRRGNQQRRQLVLESRENPWSPPERLAHRLFHDAGITGWIGNLQVVVRGHPYYVDIGFPSDQAGHRDRRARIPHRGRSLGERPMAAERPGQCRLASAALHRPDAGGGSADRAGRHRRSAGGLITVLPVWTS